MIIAEFTIDHPVLLEPLRSVPAVELVWEETYGGADGSPQMLVWIVSDDFAAVETALVADSGTCDPEQLTELEDRRLYRVTFSDLGDATNLMPHLMAVGAVLLEATGTNDGWTCRARFPDRAALTYIYQFCGDHDIPFTLGRLYDQVEQNATATEYVVTDKQRAVLRLAYEDGYFEVPKQTSLDEIAAELDVTKQAVSARLTRGLSNVLGNTLFDER